MELGSGGIKEQEEEEDQRMMTRSNNSNSGCSSSKGKLPFLHGTTSTFYTLEGHFYHPQLLPLPPSKPTNQDEEFQDQGGGGGQRDSNSTNPKNNEVILETIEKEHMFDKVVTPSDVGRLNRLVIPKQQAKKYFPLDPSTDDKLLNFEDRNGKPWRFRYSYWNSSQSYVMTKGWSRFVKEKKLHAGDVVSFQRGVGEVGKNRLYIDWIKCPNAPDLTGTASKYAIFHHQQYYHHFSNSYPWSFTTTCNNFKHPFPPPPTTSPIVPRDYHLYWGNPSRNANSYNNPVATSGGAFYGYGGTSSISPRGSIFYMGQQVVKYQQQCSGSGGGGAVVEPEVQGKEAAAAKRLRLFGVNLECPITCRDATPSNSGTPPSTQMGKPSSSSMSLDLDLSDDSDPY